MGKHPYTSWQRGIRHPRFVKGYPLEETTGVRRYKKHAVKRAQLRQPRPRIHARGPYRVKTTFDTEALRMQRAADVKGSGEERIFYQGLVDRGFTPEVDFTYQASEFGGRAELGGLVADFMFPVPKVVVQVQSYWHRLSAVTEKRDTDQTAILQSLGYMVLEIWGNTINDPAAFEDWMDRNVMHLWGTSSMPLTGSVERDEAFLMSTSVVRRIEERISKLEEAVSGEVITESELGQTLQGFDISEDVTKILQDIRLGDRLARLESALFSGGAGGPAVRISSAYIAQHLSSSNFESGATGWRISRDGTAEFQDLIARGTMQSDNFVSGSEGWRINEDGDAEFHDVTVRGQIIAATFKYNAVSTIGGAMMIGPASNLAADTTDVATTVTVVDAQFIDGDFLYIKIGGAYEVMEVTAGGGTASLTVTRGIAGTAAAWKKGTAVVRKGDRILLDTVSANSPYLDIIDHAGPLHDDESVKVRLGNLAGISDPLMSPSGYGLYSDNVFLSGTAVFGSGTVTLDSDGITILAGINDNNLVKWEDSGAKTGYVISWEGITHGRTIRMSAVPYGTGTDVGVMISVDNYGGGGTPGSPAITLLGAVGSADLNATYIDFASDKSGVGGVSMRLTREALKMSAPIWVPTGQKIVLDDDLDSYLYCVADDSMQFYTGGAARMALSNTGLVINNALALIQGQKFYLDADLDSFIYCPGTDDYIDIYTGGARRFRIEPSGKVLLTSGTSINEFSTDGNLTGNSHDAVPTEAAVKYYVDRKGHARGYRASGTLTVVSSTWTTITYTNEDYDTGADLNAGTGVFTAPVTGYYSISAHAQCISAAWPAGKLLILTLYKGAALEAELNRMLTAAVTTEIGVGGSTILYLTAGQTISARVYQNSGSNKTIKSLRHNTWFAVSHIVS